MPFFAVPFSSHSLAQFGSLSFLDKISSWKLFVVYVFILSSLFLVCICREEWAMCGHSVKAESYFSKSYANTFNLFTEQTYSQSFELHC